MPPLQRYLHPVWQDTLCCATTASEQWAWAQGYHYDACIGGLSAKQAPGQIAVVLLRHPRTNDSRLASTRSSLSCALASGYRKVRVEGYCTPPSSTVTLPGSAVAGLGLTDQSTADGGTAVTAASSAGGRGGSVPAGARIVKLGGVAVQSAAGCHALAAEAAGGSVEVTFVARPVGCALLRQRWDPTAGDHCCSTDPEPGDAAQWVDLGWVLQAPPDGAAPVLLREWVCRNLDAGSSESAFSSQMVAGAATEQGLLRDPQLETVAGGAVAAVSAEPFDGCVPLWRVAGPPGCARLVRGRELKRAAGAAPSGVREVLNVTVYGTGCDCNTYTHLHGVGMCPSDAGRDVLDSFLAYRHPAPGLTCWEIIKVKNDKQPGNWVAPAGCGFAACPDKMQHAAEGFAVQGVFWARRVDEAERREGEAVFVRWRHTNEGWSTSVGHSKYCDRNWSVLYAFDPADPEGAAAAVAINKAQGDNAQAVPLPLSKARLGQAVYLDGPDGPQKGTVEFLPQQGDSDHPVVRLEAGPRDVPRRQWESGEVLQSQPAEPVPAAWPPGALRLWRSEDGQQGAFCVPPGEVAEAARRFASISVRRTSDPSQYVRLRPGVSWPLQKLRQGLAFSRTMDGQDVSEADAAHTWEGPLWRCMANARSSDLKVQDGWLYNANGNGIGLFLRHEVSSRCGTATDIEVWLEPEITVPRPPPLPATAAVASSTEQVEGKSYICTYTAIAGLTPPPPQRGWSREPVHRFQVHTAPHPLLCRWEVRQMPGEEGNWVALTAKDGGLPQGLPPRFEGSGHWRQAVFWAAQADPRQTQVAAARVWVRWRAASKRPATSVDGGNYVDSAWRLLHAMQPAPGLWTEGETAVERFTAPDTPEGWRAERIECYAHASGGPGLGALCTLTRDGRATSVVVPHGDPLPEGAQIEAYVYL